MVMILSSPLHANTFGNWSVIDTEKAKCTLVSESSDRTALATYYKLNNDRFKLDIIPLDDYIFNGMTELSIQFENFMYNNIVEINGGIVSVNVHDELHTAMFANDFFVTTSMYSGEEWFSLSGFVPALLYTMHNC
jgi:hypothetical protein